MILDRVRIDYMSDVPPDVRDSIRLAIVCAAESAGLHTYEHYDSSCNAWSIDVAAHDRDVQCILTDGQIIGYLESIAEEKGLSVERLLRSFSDL